MSLLHRRVIRQLQRTQSLQVTARECSAGEIDAAALAIIQMVESPAQPGGLGMKPFQRLLQDAPENEGDPEPEWIIPTREELIEEHLSEYDAFDDLQAYGMKCNMRELYAWAAAHVLERQLGENPEAR